MFVWIQEFQRWTKQSTGSVCHIDTNTLRTQKRERERERFLLSFVRASYLFPLFSGTLKISCPESLSESPLLYHMPGLVPFPLLLMQLLCDEWPRHYSNLTEASFFRYLFNPYFFFPALTVRFKPSPSKHTSFSFSISFSPRFFT